MQHKSVDLVPSIDARKEVTNVQLIRGISNETTSVTFELMKLFSFFSQNLGALVAVSD